jgi:hypothetical protein
MAKHLISIGYPDIESLKGQDAEENQTRQVYGWNPCDYNITSYHRCIYI